MRARAYAKVNLSLRVELSREGGLHPIVGMFQSIDWHDVLILSDSDEDELLGHHGQEVVDGWDNLAWKAISAARDHSGTATRVRLELHKRIPVAAGLGGGSADAAAALGLGGKRFGLVPHDLQALAPALGSDVPFCFLGGRAVVRGLGDEVAQLAPAGGYGLAIVVPPVELATAAIYRSWDRLDGPTGPELAGTGLPPSLRDDGPFTNDLYSAAVDVAPAVDDWRSELSTRWARPVLLTGSGPALFAYFVDAEEAASALDEIPVGARAASAATPVDVGWEIED